MGSALRGTLRLPSVLPPRLACAAASARSPNPAEPARRAAGRHRAIYPTAIFSVHMEFTRDSVRINFGGAEVSGPYRWIDAQTIEVASPRCRQR